MVNGEFDLLTVTDKLTLKAPDGSNFVDLKFNTAGVDPINPITAPNGPNLLKISEGIHIKNGRIIAVTAYLNKWIDLQAIYFSIASSPTQTDGFTMLKIGKGGLQFPDTGGILTVDPTPNGFPTKLGTKLGYTPSTDPQDGLVNLF